MSSQPDILVTAPDSPNILLVVEVHRHLTDIEKNESALKHYMFQMGVPVGMLVSPKLMAIYRHRYREYSEKSVERIGVFKIPDSWSVFDFSHLSPEEISNSNDSKTAFIFEHNVQTWLERLRTTTTLEDFPDEAKKAISEYVLPVLYEGEVRAAHPRDYSRVQ